MLSIKESRNRLCISEKTEHFFNHYLTRARQVKECKKSLEKSLVNWLAEFVYVMSTSFSILFSKHQFEARRLSLRSCTALQNKEHFTARTSAKPLCRQQDFLEMSLISGLFSVTMTS